MGTSGGVFKDALPLSRCSGERVTRRTPKVGRISHAGQVIQHELTITHRNNGSLSHGSPGRGILLEFWYCLATRETTGLDHYRSYMERPPQGRIQAQPLTDPAT